jgi:uncharacterized protein
MSNEFLSIEVSPAIGQVSAEYIVPSEATCIITLAHGAGAGMNHPFMTTLAHSLADVGIATLRFNFPFIENKKKRADVPAVAQKTIEAAIQHARNTYSALPLFVSGKSFGGRMSSQYLALHPSSTVKGIIFYGFPLHPAGKPSIERAEHLKDVTVPMLFLQGTRDALATINMMEEVCSTVPAATLVKIEGADHAFKAGKQDIMKLLVNNTSDWLKSIVKM